MHSSIAFYTQAAPLLARPDASLRVYVGIYRRLGFTEFGVVREYQPR